MGAVSNVRRGKPQDTPSAAAAIVKAGNEPHEITDARGRKLMVRKPGALAKLRMFKAIGPVNSKNEMYLGFAMLAVSVVSIDGDLVEPAMSERDVESLVNQLGDEGLEAIAAEFSDDVEPTITEDIASAQNFR